MYFNKKAPFINIYHIGYYSGGEFVIDSSQIIHNYPSSISNLTFSYDAISLAEGDYIQTKYNVLGFDTTWQSINTNEIKFSSLPPGSYTLQIKACNNHNNWSVPKQFIFSIDYPWYRTWFAYILYVVVGGGVIYLFIKSRTKKLEEEKENLEKIVEERTAEVVEEKKVITEQKHLIEEKHREITDSINYAERIQRSFLATKEQLEKRSKRMIENNHFKGKKHTPETLNKMREAKLGTKRPKEGYIKRAEKMKKYVGFNHWNSKVVLDMETGVYYGSVKEASEYAEMNITTFIKAMKKNILKYKRV